VTFIPEDNTAAARAKYDETIESLREMQNAGWVREAAMSFLLMLLLILAAIALSMSWIAGLFVPKSRGVVVDKHITTTYITQRQGKTAYSIPLETFLLVDTFGRHCKVSRGVWANVQVGNTVEGRWRGGSIRAGRQEPLGPPTSARMAAEPIARHCQQPLPPGAGFCPVCGVDVRQAQAKNRTTTLRPTPFLGVWQLSAAVAFGFVV
jgi:hypothetical protein